jgi:hypothetical protein
VFRNRVIHVVDSNCTSFVSAKVFRTDTANADFASAASFDRTTFSGIEAFVPTRVSA